MYEQQRSVFVNNQPDAQFFFMYVHFCSLHVSGSHVPIISSKPAHQMVIYTEWHITDVVLIQLKVDSHMACRAHAVPLPCRVANGLECVFPIWFTVRPCLIHTCHAAPMPRSDHAVLLKATAQHGRRETACGLPARLRLLPATTRSSTKIVIRSIPNLLTTIHTYDSKEWYQHTTKKTIC